MKKLSKIEAKKELLKIFLSQSEFQGSDSAEVVLNMNFKEIDFEIINFILNKLDNIGKKSFINKIFECFYRFRKNNKLLAKFISEIPDDVILLLTYFVADFDWRNSSFFMDVTENAKKFLTRKFKKKSEIIKKIFENQKNLEKNKDFKITDFKLYKIIGFGIEDLKKIDKEFFKSFDEKQSEIFIKWLDENSFDFSNIELSNFIYELNNVYMLIYFVYRNASALKNILKKNPETAYIILDHTPQEVFTVLTIFDEIAKKEIDIEKLDFNILFEKIKNRKNKYKYLNLIHKIKKISKDEIFSDIEKYKNSLEFHHYISKNYGLDELEILNILNECLKYPDFDTNRLNVKELKILFAYNPDLGEKIIENNDYERKFIFDLDRPENAIQKEIDYNRLNRLARSYFEKELGKKDFDWIELLRYHQKELDDAYDAGRYS